MLNSDSIIRLLILDESLNDAEHASSAIRTLGYAVKSTRVIDIDELTERLKVEQFDICLCCTSSLEPVPVKDLVGTIAREGQHLPVIGLGDDGKIRLLADPAHKLPNPIL